MTLDDQDTARRLRAAVVGAAHQHADAALADRLLDGVVRRRRVRRLSGAAGVAALALAAAAVMAALPGDADRLVPATPGALEGRTSVPARAGAVTHEQAARAGLDGRPQCEEQAVRATSTTFGQETTSPVVRAGYLTDTAGFEQWQKEYDGSYAVYDSGVSPWGVGLVVLCWYEGDIPPDRSVGGGAVEARFRLLVTQLGPGEPQLRLDSTRATGIPILAPPLPDPALLSPEQAAQGEVVHAQHPDVPVVDVLREPPPPPPRDCFVDGCPGDEEVEYRLDITIDGEPHGHGQPREVAAGSVVSVELTLLVEKGEELRNLSVGLTPSEKGISGGEPMPEVLLQPTEPVTDTETFRFEWKTPTAPTDRILQAHWEIQPDGADQLAYIATDLAKMSVR